MPLHDSFSKRTRTNLLKMSSMPSMEDLQFSLDNARKEQNKAVYLMWVCKGEVRVLSIVCGLSPDSDDAVWVLRSGEKVDSPILWRHLTSDAQLIHMCITSELDEEGGKPAAVIPDFLRPGASSKPPGSVSMPPGNVSFPPGNISLPPGPHIIPPGPGAMSLGAGAMPPVIGSLKPNAVSQLVGDAPINEPAPQPYENTVVSHVESEDPGSVLGNRWEILEEVGKGAMGIVYKAKQLSVDRYVALKILHHHLLAKEVNKKRFEFEARAASNLAHQNLIHIYDFGTSQSGRPYIVMDYVEGPSLLDVLQHEGTLDLQSMAEIFIQICRGLSHAHRKGIVHRDLKPSNVKLADGDNNTIVVKVLDFGIAKVMKDDEQQLTRAGDIIGSPLYMSPEQCKGDNLDGRSDIYSLGCMMYQAVTGALPFVGKDPFETMYKHIYEKAPSFESIRPDLHIPMDLQNIIFKMLEIKVENRYANIEEVEQELHKLRLSGQEIKTVEGNAADQAQSMQLVSKLPAVNVANLLSQSGAVPHTEVEKVIKLTQEVGGDVGKILMATGVVDPQTLDTAVKCKRLIDKGYCNVSQAVILLGFCHRKDLSFDEGSRQLGWEFGKMDS